MVNFLRLTSSNVFAQAITLFGYLFLTRIYSVEQFAQYALYASSVVILAIVLGGRFEIAIVAAKNRFSALALSLISLLTSGILLSCMAALLVIVLICFEPMMFVVPNFVPLVFVGAAVSHFGNVARQWQTRIQRFDSIANYRVFTASGVVVLQIAFGLASDTQTGLWLIWGAIFGHMLGSAHIVIAWLRHLWKSIHRLNINRLRAIALQYAEFPRYNVFSSLIGKANHEAPTFLIGGLLGTEVLGNYALARRVLNQPLSIFGQALSQLFYSEFAKTIRSSRTHAKTLFTKIVFWQALIAVAICLCVFFFSESIFERFFGSEWRFAGPISILLLPMLFGRFVAVPIGPSLYSLGKNKFIAIWQIATFILSMLSLFLGDYLGFGNYTILLYTTCLLLGYVFYIFYAWLALRA
ncbi:MAG: oligosaccharide flippase family protein [Pseudomonadota bacterium]